MSRHILYIINPIAGTRTKKDLQQFIEQKTKAAGFAYQVFPSVASGDYSFLFPIIAEQGITDVVVAGGDGTISQVVNSLREQPVNFGIIPCGSGNGLALSAGISKQPEKALQVVLKGKAIPTDGFLINGHFSCMLSGIGFDAKVAHEFAQQSQRGLKTYASLVSRNFFNAAAYPFTINTNGFSFNTDAYFISIANSNQFGNHVTIAPKASLSDGLLDIVIIRKMSKPMLLFHLLKQVISGKPRKAEEKMLNQAVIYFQSAALRISNPSAAPLHIDGDPTETAGEFEILVLKKCFRLICPAD